MDRLISENKVLEAIDNLKANFTCYDFVTLDEVASHVKTIPSAEPKTGYISIDDVMSVFDDFMCGEVDEEGTETFWEMLKDKAEREIEL